MSVVQSPPVQPPSAEWRHGSNITRYYHRFKYTPHEFAKHVFIASICCVIQFGTPDNFGRNITMLEQSYYLHVVVGSVYGVSTRSFFEYW